MAKINKTRHDSKNNPVTYVQGDFVRVRSEATKQGLSRKLRSDLWSKPTKILEVKENNVKLLGMNDKTKWVNQSRIKKAETKVNF